MGPRTSCIGKAVLAAVLALAGPGAIGQTDPTSCRIVAHEGAGQPEGALIRAEMENRGQSCTFENHAQPQERAGPAGSGRILRPPGHGKAVFSAPSALYTPEAGFAGDDEFEYEALVYGRGGKSLRMLVKVRISVRPSR